MKMGQILNVSFCVHIGDCYHHRAVYFVFIKSFAFIWTTATNVRQVSWSVNKFLFIYLHCRTNMQAL